MIALDQAGRALSGATVVPAPPELAPWVEEGWVDRVAGNRWKIVPDDAPHIIYSETARAEGGVARRTMLVGARSRALELDRSARRRTVAVRLRPGALPSLFGVAAHELVDRSIGLDDLPSTERGRGGSEGPSLAHRLGAVEAGEGPAVLFGWLGERLASGGAPAEPDWRIRALPDLRAGARPGATPVGGICRELGVSSRSYRQAFRHGVGLAPSTVLRIRRLHAALTRGLRGPEPWSRVAHSCGYADQSHLIRDCRDLLGETPEAFRSRCAGEDPGSSVVPIHSSGGRRAG